MAENNYWWNNWNLSYLPDTYGEVVGGHSVQEAMYATLEKWLPSYVMEINRQLGEEVLQIPTEYRFRPDYRTLPKSSTAAILIDVTGTSGRPQVYQQATRANWEARVMIFVYGTKDWQETQAMTNAYAAAVRAAIVQHRSLGGFADTTIWTGEDYREGEHSGTRTTGLAVVHFEVTVGNAVNIYGGPPSPAYAGEGSVTDPSLLPPSPAVTSTEVNVNLNKESL
jgi:hypothetical protein